MRKSWHLNIWVVPFCFGSPCKCNKIKLYPKSITYNMLTSSIKKTFRETFTKYLSRYLAITNIISANKRGHTWSHREDVSKLIFVIHIKYLSPARACSIFYNRFFNVFVQLVRWTQLVLSLFFIFYSFFSILHADNDSGR